MKTTTTIISALIAVTFALLVYTAFISSSKDQGQCQRFYDGEGNEIPAAVVNLYVQSHFVHMEQNEKDSINKYFYVNKLK